MSIKVKNRTFNRIFPFALIIVFVSFFISIAYYPIIKSVPIRDTTHTYEVRYKGNPPTFKYITENEGKILEIAFATGGIILAITVLSAFTLNRMERKDNV